MTTNSEWWCETNKADSIIAIDRQIVRQLDTQIDLHVCVSQELWLLCYTVEDIKFYEDFYLRKCDALYGKLMASERLQKPTDTTVVVVVVIAVGR